jgi:hypothetical protein
LRSKQTESLELFIEDQDFSPPYDLATQLIPLSPGSKLDRRPTGSLRKRENLLTGKGGGGKPDPL